MSNQSQAERALVAVIIVGAGLGGLMLAILLDQIDIPYHIFERAAEVRPLGSAMSLGPNILPVFEQLGLLEDLKAISLPCPSVEVYGADMKSLGSVNLRGHKTLSGYEHLVVARPDLYKLMRERVPAEKISMGKKVLRTEEKEGRVFIHCSDSTSYEGDILVGADGAYSSVRQSLYKCMNEKGILPKVDLENFAIGYVSMVGVAQPKYPEKFAPLKNNFSTFSQVLGEGSRNWMTVNVPGNKICWLLGVQLPDAQAKEQQFRNSEWGPEANDAMIKDFQSLPSPWGGTMGEIIDATPGDRISKVYLEEKIFKTWYHGRTVLIGDAAHKMVPSAGQGAVNAMQDAVVLANCIHHMSDSTPKSVTGAFDDFYRQRFEHAEAQFNRSSTAGKVLMGQTWTHRFIRYAMLNYIPVWFQRQRSIKGFAYRPQIAWLPLAENRGIGPVLPQEGRRRSPPKQAQAL